MPTNVGWVDVLCQVGTSANARQVSARLQALGGVVGEIEGYAGEKGAYQTNELLRSFANLKIVHYEDVWDEADWAPREKSHIVRFIAEKPQK